MFRPATFKIALCAALALIPISAQASLWTPPGPAMPAPALALPTDFGRHPGDGAILQIGYLACGGDANCTNAIWTNPFVGQCRDGSPGDVICFGPMGAVNVAIRSQTMSAPPSTCPEGSITIASSTGLVCMPEVIVD